MLTIKNKSLNNYKFIDLFAGLGGFRLALESLGAKCVYSNEWDKAAQDRIKVTGLNIAILVTPFNSVPIMTIINPVPFIFLIN